MSRPDSASPLSSSSSPDGPPTLFDCIDHPTVWRWMLLAARREPDAFARFIGPNVPRCWAVFGRPRWRAHGAWTHAWSVQEQGLAWVIRSGPDGTVFLWRLRADAEGALSDAHVGAAGVSTLARWFRSLTEDNGG